MDMLLFCMRDRIDGLYSEDEMIAIVIMKAIYIQYILGVTYKHIVVIDGDINHNTTPQ